LPIEIGDCRLPIEQARPRAFKSSIDQSQPTIDGPNRQSTVPIVNRQSSMPIVTLQSSIGNEKARLIIDEAGL
jgi:hypothetical protein